jgi:hypothetical protein
MSKSDDRFDAILASTPANATAATGSRAAFIGNRKSRCLPTCCIGNHSRRYDHSRATWTMLI